MRNLNENIARKVNEEDNCTGKILGRQVQKPGAA
jgi:hypothetical protein